MPEVGCQQSHQELKVKAGPQRHTSSLLQFFNRTALVLIDLPGSAGSQLGGLLLSILSPKCAVLTASADTAHTEGGRTCCGAGGRSPRRGALGARGCAGSRDTDRCWSALGCGRRGACCQSRSGAARASAASAALPAAAARSAGSAHSPAACAAPQTCARRCYLADSYSISTAFEWGNTMPVGCTSGFEPGFWRFALHTRMQQALKKLQQCMAAAMMDELSSKHSSRGA